MTTTYRSGDPEPTDEVAVVDRFSRLWEPLTSERVGLWRHAGEQVTWGNLLVEHGPVTSYAKEVAR